MVPHRILIALALLLAALVAAVPFVVRAGASRAEVAPPVRASDARTAAHVDLAGEHAAGTERTSPRAPKLRGRVLDETSGAPIPGVRVQLKRRAPPELVAAEVPIRIEEAQQVLTVALDASGEASRSDALVSGRILFSRLVLQDLGRAAEPAAAQDPSPAEAQVATEAGTQAQAEAGIGTTASTSVAAAAAEDRAPEDPGAAPQEQAQPADAETPAPEAGAAPSPSLTFLAQRGFANVAFERHVADAIGQVSFEPAAMQLSRPLAFQLSGGEAWLPVVSGFVTRTRRFGTPIVVAETTTDAAGGFEFDCPAEDGHWLELARDGAVRCTPDEHAVGDPARACARDIEWRVRRVAWLTARGRVLAPDGRTPVADVQVVLREVRTGRLAGEEDLAWSHAVTAADGRFEMADELPAGALRAEAVDVGSELAIELEAPRLELLASGEELALVARAGPTLRFDAALPAPMLAHGLVARWRGVESASFDLGAWSDALLHDSGGRFARLPADARRSGSGPARFELATMDGRFAGALEIAALDRLPVNPPVVSFELRAALLGRVRCGEDAAPRAELAIRDARGAVREALVADEDGTFLVRALPNEQDLRLEVTLPADGDGPPLTRSLTFLLGAGEAREIDVDLLEPR